MASTQQPSLSPVEDISPKSPEPGSGAQRTEYFTKENNNQSNESNEIEDSAAGAKTNDSVGSSERRSSNLSDATPAPVSQADESTSGGAKVEWKGQGLRRHSSVSSVTIQTPRNPSLPQGNERNINRGRLRKASPKPNRFQNRVAFDNLPLGEATKNNTPSLTLNVKHRGYRAGRRSRTFMVGVDEHAYSDYALQWLLDELVDDGDEIVCVRVMEKEIRANDKQYQEEAQAIMRSILEKNGANRALSFILEYAAGKLHGTFQKLIHMYQPAMLIVGTRGRSLGGLQGLVNTRNSFSKYCLQYSPVPVVVVRPTEKRIKKKEKRAADSTRQTYAGMLAATFGKHEADSGASSSYEFEVKTSQDEEAHQVAKVLGLPAAFDPTIKPISPSHLRTSLSPGPVSPRITEEGAEGQNQPPVAPVSNGSDSSDSEEEGEGEGEFEVVPGKQALDQQKMEQLHKMEVGEAAALRMKVDSDEESDDEGNNKSTS